MVILIRGKGYAINHEMSYVSNMFCSSLIVRFERPEKVGAHDPI